MVFTIFADVRTGDTFPAPRGACWFPGITEDQKACAVSLSTEGVITVHGADQAHIGALYE